MTTKRSRPQWLDHVNLTHPPYFQQLSKTQREIRGQQKEQLMASQQAPNEDLQNINAEVI
jgi:hypothetical protein